MDWVWPLFPLEHEDSEALNLDDLARHAHGLLDRDAEDGERTRMGDVLHWAHHLKTEQDETGDWPMSVNARTGEVLGRQRTLAPARLMRRLERILMSTEFTDCIARAGKSRSRRS